MSGNLTPRILVVDDDLTVIAAYRYVLEGDERRVNRRRSWSPMEEELFGEPNMTASESADWRAHFVDHGDDAVVAVRNAISAKDPFAVVFLDISMSEGPDGYETARLIRKLDPFVHIVFVSDFHEYTEDMLLDAAGPADQVSFLPKPVWPDQLESKARAVCNAGRARA